MRVINRLEHLEWDVEISAYYYDDTTNKPRECDIIAQKEIQVKPIGPVVDKFKVFLFIECKHFKGEVAFRMHQSHPEAKAMKDIKSAIIIYDINKEKALKNINHHYLWQKNIAKLYDSVDEEKNIFNAITQSVKSLTFFKERQPEKGLYYPVVVYSGIDGIYPIDSTDLSLLQTLTPEKYLILGLNYSYRSVVSGFLETQYFLIDFVHESEFINYLQTISRDADALKERLALMYMRKNNP